MKDDELIAAGHELAKCLDSNTPLIDIAKLLSKMATQLDVTTAALREKTKQCEALAAENAALKSWAEKRAKSDDALEQERYSTLKIDYRQRMLSNIQTPATDAFLREVRAQGVDMAACALDGVNQFNYANMLDELVQKLRQGGAA
ncbi:hypothetical protein ACRV4U_000058 [Cronobacter sakazakii]